MNIEARGKWAAEVLFWEITDGETSLCVKDEDLRSMAYHQMSGASRYVDVIRQCHVDACWPVLITQ